MEVGRRFRPGNIDRNEGVFMTIIDSFVGSNAGSKIER
jgi:hypothetical protein